jgi:mitochondrial import receptor subunit TOM40
MAWILQLQVGVEFEASTRMQDTSVSFGYQLDLPKANLLFKGKPWFSLNSKQVGSESTGDKGPQCPGTSVSKWPREARYAANVGFLP